MLKSTVSVGASPNVVNEPPIVKLPVISTLGALTFPWNTMFPTLLKLIADLVASITLPWTTILSNATTPWLSVTVSLPLRICTCEFVAKILSISKLVLSFSKSTKNLSPTLKLPLWSCPVK